MNEPPPFVSLDLTGWCNLKCTGCVLDEDYPARGAEMDLRLLGRLEPQIASLPGIGLSCNAEPLLHPEVAQAVRWLRARTSGRICLTTNGTRLDPRLAQALVMAGLDEIAVSLDGTEPAVFEGIRKGARLDVVLANVRGLVQARHRLGSPTPSLTVVFTSRRANLSSLPGIVDMAADLGAASVVVNGLEPYRLDLQEEVLYGEGPPNGAVAAIFDRLRERAAARAVRLALPELTIREPASCRFLVPTVSPLGEVSPCPATSYARTCFAGGRMLRYPRIVFGNLREEALSSIWPGEPYAAFRRQASGARFEEPACRACLLATGVVCPIEGRAPVPVPAPGGGTGGAAGLSSRS